MIDQRASGTVAGLLRFLAEVGDEPGLHPTTIQAIQSAWRSVTRELEIPSGTRVDTLSPDNLVDEFERQRGGSNFRSGATYRTRLRVGQQLYEAWLAEDPDWTDVARKRGTTAAQSINRSESGQPRLRLLQFPLRRDLVINAEVPEDLTYEEVDRISSFYRSLVIPAETDAAQREAPAT